MYIYLLISLPHVNFCKIFIKAAFELKTKLIGSNDRFHSGSGVQELKRKMTDIEKVINSSKSRSSAMFTKLPKKEKKNKQNKKSNTKRKVLSLEVYFWSLVLTVTDLVYLSVKSFCPVNVHFSIIINLENNVGQIPFDIFL